MIDKAIGEDIDARSSEKARRGHHQFKTVKREADRGYAQCGEYNAG